MSFSNAIMAFGSSALNMPEPLTNTLAPAFAACSMVLSLIPPSTWISRDGKFLLSSCVRVRFGMWD